MTDTDRTSSTRRYWIAAAARWGTIGAIAAVCMRVSGRGPLSNERACVDVDGKTGCGTCGLFTDCRLPRALSVRQFLESRVHEERQS